MKNNREVCICVPRGGIATVEWSPMGLMQWAENATVAIKSDTCDPEILM